jgi:hypothetical protein
MGIVSGRDSAADEGAAGGSWTSGQLTVMVQFVRPTSGSNAVSPSPDVDRDAANQARVFVQAADVQVRRAAAKVAVDASESFEIGTARATLVGANLVSFVDNVLPAQREDIVRALVLAQMAATKRIGKPKTMLNVRMWYDRYFEVLANIGFSLMDDGSIRTRVSQGPRFDATEAMEEITQQILAGSPDATRALTRSLQVLRSLPKDSPLSVRFNRDSLSSNVARFQATVAYQESAQLRLLSVAFGLETESRLKRILVTKLRSGSVSLWHTWRTFAVQVPILEGIRESIKTKLDPHASQVAEYVQPLPDA